MNSPHPAVIHICTIKMIFEGLNQTKMTEVHFTMYNTILVFLLQNLPEISEWKLLRSKFYTICFPTVYDLCSSENPKKMIFY